MTFVRGVLSTFAAIALSGCTLIGLDGLSDASGGGSATSSATTTSTATATATTTTTTDATSNASATTTSTAASSSGTGCSGPTYCEGSNAQFCDDFDTATSRAHWFENVAVEPGTIYELAFVEEGALSCPYAAKSALNEAQPDNTYVQWYRAYSPGQAFDSASFAFSALKQQAADPGVGIIASIIYGVSTGEYCEILINQNHDGVGIYAQRIFAMGGATQLADAPLALPPSTFGIWLDHDLYFASQSGMLEIEYKVRTDDGNTFTLPILTLTDDACGEGAITSTLDVKLGSNYLGEAPNVTYFDDVELELDP